MCECESEILKSYVDLLINDRRPLDQWRKRIGKHYKDKDWEELNQEEMKADFDWKNDLLRMKGEEVNYTTFYEYLFSNMIDKTEEMFFESVKKDKDGVVLTSIKDSYKLVLNKYDDDQVKVKKIDLDQLDDYMKYNDVALSPCLFYKNYRRKKLLNYVGAFVLDIDKLRPFRLELFFELFDEKRLLTPTFIVNSGSGVHFYYVLKEMFRCDIGSWEANNRIVEAIYKSLYDDVIIKEKYPDAQRHWIGQDYRVVGSKTKLNKTCSAFQIGEFYTIEQLMNYFDIKIKQTTHYASHDMMKYAKSIAKDLKLELPDFENAKATYEFIAQNKDAAYQVRAERRATNQEHKQKRKDKRKQNVSWYRNTLDYVMKNASIGNRFSSLKALAVIAYKEKVEKERFEYDLNELVAHWKYRNEHDKVWINDKFNEKNIEAIIRLFEHCEPYRNTSSETLEEWLGIKFKRIGFKRNGRKRKEHLHAEYWVDENEKPRINVCRENRKLGYLYAKNNGKIGGSDDKQKIIIKWREEHPSGSKADCIRDTKLSKHTVLKWWNIVSLEYYDSQKKVQEWRKANPEGTKYRCIKDTGLDKKTVYKWWNSMDQEDNKGE